MDFPQDPGIGLVDGRFVDENAATGSPGSTIPASWGNGLTDEMLNVIRAAGLTPDENNVAQLLEAIRGLASGVVGQVRNLRMSVTAASATATLTADEIVVGSALGGRKYILGNFNQTINLAMTGAGGMDTGSATAGGFLGLYAIHNPVTGARALLGTMEATAALPSVYGGANMPSGYTASALVAVVPISATAGQFASFSVQDRRTTIPEFTFVNSSTASSTGGNTAFTAKEIPMSAVRASGSLSISNSTSQNSIWKFFADANSTGSKQFSVNTIGGGGGNLFGFTSIPLAAPQTIRATAYVAAGSGTMSYILLIAEYEI